MDADVAAAPRAALSVAHLYTPLAEVSAAQTSQRSEKLMKEVMRFARAPRALLAGLCGGSLLLFRATATPNFETIRFHDLAKRSGRSFVILESPHDWFTPFVNTSKRSLARPSVHLGLDRRGAERWRGAAVTEFTEPERRRIQDKLCFNGTPLTEFHHHLGEVVLGADFRASIIPAADFFGSDPPLVYYERLFALLTCFGALVESFLVEGRERAFTENVIVQAFEASVRRFGARPMIVRLLPEHLEMEPYWERYPPEAWPLIRGASRRCVPR